MQLQIHRNYLVNLIDFGQDFYRFSLNELHRKDSSHETLSSASHPRLPYGEPDAGTGGFPPLRQPRKPHDLRHGRPSGGPCRRKGGCPIKALTHPSVYAGGSASPARSRGEAGYAQSCRLLDQHTRDMVTLAAQGRYDPVAGREVELNRLLQILLRRSKRNPVLLGDPGVGKTAVAEALAQRMARGLVPEQLRSCRLLALDLGSLVAGTKYRGEFEERIRDLLREAARAGNVILFLDELHTLLGSGSAEGAIDGANLLKPALARGELQMIGATTSDEYRKLTEKDPALERRFQPVRVPEPSPEGARAILRTLAPRYGLHHGLTFQPEALDAAVELSVRYLPDRRLPDKAIDLLDEAAALARMRTTESSRQLRALENRVRQAGRARDEAVDRQDYESAARYRDAETDFRQALEEERQRCLADRSPSPVTAGEIARVVSLWTGIPLEHLTRSERDQLLDLEVRLRRRVIGQDAAISAVARAVRRSRAGLKEPGRPAGAFLFLGPSGVGKTELCKGLAQALFGAEDALLRFDMSEFSQSHTASRLTGAPPGYVGHEDGGQLTEAVRRRPYAVVLFDELEKAHPDVWSLLLQIMEDGILTDAHGRRTDFRNTIIVMTSNAGGERLSAGISTGFAPPADAGDVVQGELRRMFRPEFLGRLDEIVVFHALSPEHMEDIARKLLGEFSRRLEKNGVAFLPSAGAVGLLARQGSDPRYGARPLRRLIRTKVEDPAAELLLREQVSAGGTLYLEADGDRLVLSPLA